MSVLSWAVDMLTGRAAERGEKVGYEPKSGHEWNPLKKHRNMRCPCGSGMKVKHCHGQLDTLPADAAKTVRRYLKRRGK